MFSFRITESSFFFDVLNSYHWKFIFLVITVMSKSVKAIKTTLTVEMLFDLFVALALIKVEDVSVIRVF